MNIKLNGEDITLNESELTVSQLLTTQEVKMPEMVSVEYNGDILDRDKFEKTQIKEGDEIEFLYFMGGGVQ